MKQPKQKRKINTLFRMIIYRLKMIPWGHILVVLLSLIIASAIVVLLIQDCYKNVDTSSILTNLLTVNGVFSAILITYLFSRITWTKDRKLEIQREAIDLSQKITEFRKILNKLTLYYNVWQDDNSTKSLIDSGKYRNIDFYDFRLCFISDYNPPNRVLIEELSNHENYRDGISRLYLAMASLVRNRNNPHYEFNEELYSEFETNRIYNDKIIEKWLDCDIFSTIYYWLDREDNQINYMALSRENRNFIKTAAIRINQKYTDYDLNNTLIKEIASDMDTHYLKELYLRLKELRKGITDLNLLIIILITVSLLFGVLFPFLLLLISSKAFWFKVVVGFLSGINGGLISYFIIRFPILIKRELKWLE